MRKPPKGWNLDRETKQITREGVHIATYTPDAAETVEWVSEEFRKYAPPVASVVKNYEASFSRTLDAVSATIAADDAAKTETTNTVEEAVVIDAPEVEEVIPPMPKTGVLGYKTPEVIEWYQQYHPEEFLKKYLGKHILGGVLQEDGTISPPINRKRSRGNIPLGNM